MNTNIPIANNIIPMYDDVLEDILEHRHTHYTFPGGRGSTKSSFVGIDIVLLIISNPDIHAVCFRKVANTIKFKGVSGSLTDGGAINTLTSEEIAVATAKGWTVTLT